MTRTPPNEIRWPKRIATLADARKYIDALGFCVLFPVKNVALPSLYWPVTRRGPDDDFVFDRYFERIWRWKDELPRRRYAIYAKYFRGRGTFISPEYLPYFLAMRETAVGPADHARLYAEGRIRDDARSIWEALADEGPLATLELRHLCHMETKAGNVRFKRAMLDLQSLLLVGHFGKEQETGAWESTRFELTCRAFPAQTAAAFAIDPAVARGKLAAKYRQSKPGAPPVQLSRLFGWSRDETAAAISAAQGATQNPKGKNRG
ncbi:MAG TPA: hypothetical protein VK757_06425 [Candidatus Acidoferrum sp.]|nr:hypothetical protein [Candidatus Acidoferrum sp.]